MLFPLGEEGLREIDKRKAYPNRKDNKKAFPDLTGFGNLLGLSAKVTKLVNRDLN